MQVKPTIGTVVGKADTNHWGQILMMPAAYGVVEVEAADGIARSRGVTILTKLSRLVETSPKSLSDAQAVADESLTEGLVSLILLVPVGTVVYLVLRGEGAIYLKRGQQLACLLDQAGELSGELKPGDTLLLVSRGFTQALSHTELAHVFDHLSAREAAEKLTLLLHEAVDGQGGAGLIFQVSELVPLEAVPLESPEAVVAQPIYEKMVKSDQILTGVATVKRLLSRRQLSRLAHGLSRLLPAFVGRNKLVALAASILILIFVTSVVVGVSRQLASAQDTQTTKTLADAQHAFDEGVALLALNSVKGRERLSQAKTLLTPLATSVSPKTKLGRQVKALYQQVLDNLQLALQITHAEPQLFYDAGLLKKAAAISNLALDADNLALLDKAGKTVFSLDISTKNGQILAGGDSQNLPTLVGLHGDNVYVLTSAGIAAIRLSDKTSTLVVKPDSQWGTIGAVVAFGGNLYLLDTTKSRIWKYVATSTGFSELREYLNPDTLPNLGQTTGMAIDGAVWLGTSQGKILRFSQGKEATFVPAGVEPGLGANLLVYTSDEVNNLYVLDKEQKRVVVLDKGGRYVAQYEWSGNLAPSQIVVSEKQKKIFLLIEGKIYTLGLK